MRTAEAMKFDKLPIKRKFDSKKRKYLSVDINTHELFDETGFTHNIHFLLKFIHLECR